MFGALVQLVRIHACHAWGHGFESRTHRQQLQGKIRKSSDSQQNQGFLRFRAEAEYGVSVKFVGINVKTRRIYYALRKMQDANPEILSS